MKIANKASAAISIIFGDDELAKDRYIIRDMKNSKEKTVHAEEIDEAIIEMLTK